MSQIIGLIGVGQIGSDVSFLAVNAGYNVVLSNSRGPESLEPIVKELGEAASASTPAEIAADKDIEIVILSIPLSAVPKALPAYNLKNKLIIDTSNYYPFRDGEIKELLENEVTTSEYVKSFLDPSNTYVKAFNNIDAVHLRVNATQDASKQNILLIAGDDEASNAKAENFVNSLGFQVYDAGSLKDSWRFEPQTPFYLTPYFPEISDETPFEERKVQFKALSNIITKDQAKELLDSATRPQKVGGTLESTPDFLVSLMMESMNKAAELKAQGTTQLASF